MTNHRTYTVTANRFHGGYEISTHRSLRAAIRALDKHACTTCQCGGPSLWGDDGDGAWPIDVAPRSHYPGREGFDLRVAWALAEAR